MILIHFERSDACAEVHGLTAGRWTLTFDATDGSWIQLTHDTLRSQDGGALACLDDGDWVYDGMPYSDILIEFKQLWYCPHCNVDGVPIPHDCKEG